MTSRTTRRRRAGRPAATCHHTAALEDAGITLRSVDLGSGDFADIPTDFSYVLHLSWFRAELAHLEQALRTNVEGAGLLLQHCRNAKAALVMSGMGIYSPSEDPWHAYTESDPIGRSSTAYAPTSPASKLGVEAVARFCARAFELPTVITRLNTFFGGPISFPGMHVHAVLSGDTMTAPSDPNIHTPIHPDDMFDQLEALLDAASTTATITNWCGDMDVTAQDWISVAAEISGLPGNIETRHVPNSPAGTPRRPDPSAIDHRAVQGRPRAGVSGPVRADGRRRHFGRRLTRTASPVLPLHQEVPPTMRLTGKVALVTGATYGIGSTIVERLAEEGASVVFTGRSGDKGQRLEELWHGQGHAVTFARGDVSIEDDVKAAIDVAVATYGSITTLVNNAAATDVTRPGGGDSHVADILDADFDRMLARRRLGCPLRGAPCAAALHGDTAAGRSSTSRRHRVCGPSRVAPATRRRRAR